VTALAGSVVVRVVVVVTVALAAVVVVTLATLEAGFDFLELRDSGIGEELI